MHQPSHGAAFTSPSPRASWHVSASAITCRKYDRDPSVDFMSAARRAAAREKSFTTADIPPRRACLARGPTIVMSRKYLRLRGLCITSAVGI